MDGILPLWKPKGFTSHDCVMKMRKIFKMKKVGHTGTLDPDAEGVLPICFGQATKIVPFLTDTTKTYRAVCKLGRTTETEDASGVTVSEQAVTEPPTDAQIEAAFNLFKGEITQIPPMYSAIKVNGRKLYEYARNNETVERPKRQVHIYALTLLPNLERSADTFTFEIVCGKGTYIRTLCVDIGAALGYPAHMAALERTATGVFDQQHAITFEKLEEAAAKGELEQLLQPLARGVEHLPVWEVDSETGIRVQYGQKLQRPENCPADQPFLVKYQQEILAVYQVNPKNTDEIKPVRVFTEEQKSR